MQTRVSFNSGEFSPDMACRSDIDQFGKGCSCLENWEVAQTGGLRRRRGMRAFGRALGAESRLFPYIYSYAEGDGFRYLVEVTRDAVRVIKPSPKDYVKVFRSSDDLPFSFDLATLHCKQINKLLILTSVTQAPMVLSFDGVSWDFYRWPFKHRPWRYNEVRDLSIGVQLTDADAQTYTVTFPSQLPSEEKPAKKFGTDYLRASVYMDQAESGYVSRSLRAGLIVVPGADYTMPATAAAGDRFAVLGEARYKCYTCIQKFVSADHFVEGFLAPENYPQFFKEVSDDSAYANVAETRTLNGANFELGDKVRFVVQYWEYYTCVKNFAAASAAGGKFADLPDYFMRGIRASDALPCCSSWAFYCSGLWYGEYEVKRNFYRALNYDSRWETVGVSRSLYGAAANVQVSGNEENEECNIRLYLTKSIAWSETNPGVGFISDACQNKIVVSAYLHDEVFAYSWNGNAALVTSLSKIHATFTQLRTVQNWSWAAFSARYGYPLFAEVFQSRLVFAATKAQPQTLWLSRTDDLDNFRLGNVDDAALALTLNTTSQNPICWVLAQANRIMLGTGESEFAIGGGSSNLLTYKNAQASDHGHVGSAAVDALPVVDKVLYVERGSGRVYEYSYSLEVDGYVSRDLSVFAPHILNGHGGAIRSALIRKPDTVAAFTLGDGQLALCTYNAHEEVKAWHRWVTDGTILDVCALPDGVRSDRLFLVVQRGENAYIEVVDEDSDFVDNGGRAYVSKVVTNSLSGYSESAVGKRPSFPVAVCFGAEVDLAALRFELSTNGGEETDDWRVVNDNSPRLKAGWNTNLLGRAEWGFDRRVGLRVSGNAAFEVLALQG